MVVLLLTEAPTVDMGPWLSAAQTQLYAGISTAGPFIFGIMAVVAGIGLVMTLIKRVTGGN